MLTPDQVRVRLEQAQRTHHEESCWLVLDLLHEILPELVGVTEENERLRRALRLSEASRGVPSALGRD